MLSSGGEEDMATLLGTLHTTPRSALRLKCEILKALLSCLRDSHRTRTVFRKVGGFVYVTSVLVALENRLTQRGNDNESTESEVLALLHIVFYTISTAMRFEPANAKFFYHEICTTTLCDTLRLLGCFSTDKTKCFGEYKIESPSSEIQSLFNGLFTGSVLEPK